MPRNKKAPFTAEEDKLLNVAVNKYLQSSQSKQICWKNVIDSCAGLGRFTSDNLRQRWHNINKKKPKVSKDPINDQVENQSRRIKRNVVNLHSSVNRGSSCPLAIEARESVASNELEEVSDIEAEIEVVAVNDAEAVNDEGEANHVEAANDLEAANEDERHNNENVQFLDDPPSYYSPQVILEVVENTVSLDKLDECIIELASQVSLATLSSEAFIQLLSESVKSRGFAVSTKYIFQNWSKLGPKIVAKRGQNISCLLKPLSAKRHVGTVENEIKAFKEMVSQPNCDSGIHQRDTIQPCSSENVVASTSPTEIQTDATSVQEEIEAIEQINENLEKNESVQENREDVYNVLKSKYPARRIQPVNYETVWVHTESDRFTSTEIEKIPSGYSTLFKDRVLNDTEWRVIITRLKCLDGATMNQFANQGDPSVLKLIMECEGVTAPNCPIETTYWYFWKYAAPYYEQLIPSSKVKLTTRIVDKECRQAGVVIFWTLPLQNYDLESSIISLCKSKILQTFSRNLDDDDTKKWKTGFCKQLFKQDHVYFLCTSDHLQLVCKLFKTEQQPVD